jgi:acyl-CoA synthetase (AMP-forming)/AMP-acid ligase II
MDLSAVMNTTDIIDRGAAALGDQDMLILGDERLTWNDMQARAGQVANALAAEGVGSQDRVAFIDKNSVEYFELAFGAAYRNAVTVAVNWRLAPPEMAYIVNDSQATVLVIHEEFAEQLAAFEAELEHVTRIVVVGSVGDHVSSGGTPTARTARRSPTATRTSTHSSTPRVPRVCPRAHRSPTPTSRPCSPPSTGTWTRPPGTCA